MIKITKTNIRNPTSMDQPAIIFPHSVLVHDEDNPLKYITTRNLLRKLGNTHDMTHDVLIMYLAAQSLEEL